MEEVVALLKEIKGEIISIQTELLLMKFAIEEVERRTEYISENLHLAQDNAPMTAQGKLHVEKF
jgi:hypothetical protein